MAEALSRYSGTLLPQSAGGEVIGDQPLGVAAQEHQDVGVAVGQGGGAQLAVLVGDLPAAAVGAEHGQACGGCRVGCGGSGQPEQGQLVLDRDDGCPNRGQGCGEATWVPPVRSIAPMNAPVSGS